MAKKSNRDLADDILNAVHEGTKQWTRTVKAEERSPSLAAYRHQRMTKERGVSFKEAAAEIMEKAYNKVSGNGRLPANARQIMYAARPHILERTGNPKLDDKYFTQVLLPDYLDENDVDWDVVYDARGHFAEPYDGEHFGLGTLEVRGYLSRAKEPSVDGAGFSRVKVTTKGPSGNFGAVLFIEKEGFDPILEAAEIAERFDLALMSTKGMSVTAARQLADEMCSEYDIPLLLLHDFDKSGFSIAGTLQRDTRRYQFTNDIEVIDLGLALADVEAMGLETEYQYHAKGSKDALIRNLRENGASSADISFMFRDFDGTRSTRRVELNAMTSPQFVGFVERKLKENGIAKVVPDDDDLLIETFRHMERGRLIAKAIKNAKLDEIDIEGIEAPTDLDEQVRKFLAENPTKRWDAAIAEIIIASPKEEPAPRDSSETRTRPDAGIGEQA
jgi:hypothetical protein